MYKTYFVIKLTFKLLFIETKTGKTEMKKLIHKIICC